jgi:excisionase family DNA binding protein
MTKRNDPNGTLAITRFTPFDRLPQVLTPRDLQAYLGIGKTATYELLKSRRITSTRLGHLIRIPRASLLAILKEW